MTQDDKFARTQPIVNQEVEKTKGLDLNDTEHIADMAGVAIPEGEELQVQETLENRDQERWQLDPDSAADHPR
ncbi:MAG: hypothetical protein HC835_08055 [Oscillatoriales cyanobacterium RM2_1_1]|nr:hypothetical protein [Oscillatoriales cyanobacterium RM2_1_1]